MSKQKNKGLIAAILFATIAITGSVVFLGYQIGNSGSSGDMNDRINEAVAAALRDAQTSNETVSELTEDDIVKVNRKDHVRGDKNAIVSLIEYSDFQCPYCTRFHATAQEIVDNNPETVNWVYRHFPLPSHKQAFNASLASECVADIGGSDEFWEYTDLLFKAGPSSINETSLVTNAIQLGIDADKFNKCFDSQEFKEKVEADLASGQKSGINSTPGILVVNNETGAVIRVRGALPTEDFERVIEYVQQQ